MVFVASVTSVTYAQDAAGDAKAGETKTVVLGSRVAKFDDAELWSLAGKGTVNVSKVKPANDERAIPAQLPDDPFEIPEEPF